MWQEVEQQIRIIKIAAMQAIINAQAKIETKAKLDMADLPVLVERSGGYEREKTKYFNFPKIIEAYSQDSGYKHNF